MDIDADYSGINVDRFKLLKKIGNGRFGSVYKAFDLVLKVEKAVKLLSINEPDKAYLLFREAEIPYKCKHQNIVEIFGGQLAILNGERIFLIDMELVNQGSVEERLLKRSENSVVSSLSIMKDVLFGIQHSHNQGIVHRDIKPGNILVHNGVAKVSDFGLASTLNEIIPGGTWYIPHRAPESFHTMRATSLTDIYALGITMFRIANQVQDWGMYLNQFKNLGDLIIRGKLIDKLVPEPFVPRSIHRVIKKACSADPSKRFQSASEMRDAIMKMKINYSWSMVEEDHWRGESIESSTKDILLKKVRKLYHVIVKNNDRRITNDCRCFLDKDSAKGYFYGYISDTTLS